jgi:hypothetical protein
MIVSNQVKCLKCGDTPYSSHRHDFVYCSCGSIAVDGGQEYLRRVGDIHNCVDISIDIPEQVVHKCIDAVDWGKDTRRNSRGIAYAVLRALRDSGYNLNGKE